MINYDQYYKKGGTYVIPVEIFNDLLGELEELHNKINKAIEYIKELYDNTDDITCYYIDRNTRYDLLEILKDSDVNE